MRSPSIDRMCHLIVYCSQIGMRQDKVAQRKNKSRKNKEATIKVIKNNISSSASPARSSSSGDSNENESMLDEEYLETKGEQIDICDIAEQCVMEELNTDTDITDLIIVETLDIDQEQS